MFLQLNQQHVSHAKLVAALSQPLQDSAHPDPSLSLENNRVRVGLFTNRDQPLPELIPQGLASHEFGHFVATKGEA